MAIGTFCQYSTGKQKRTGYKSFCNHCGILICRTRIHNNPYCSKCSNKSYRTTNKVKFWLGNECYDTIKSTCCKCGTLKLNIKSTKTYYCHTCTDNNVNHHGKATSYKERFKSWGKEKRNKRKKAKRVSNDEYRPLTLINRYGALEGTETILGTSVVSDDVDRKGKQSKPREITEKKNIHNGQKKRTYKEKQTVIGNHIKAALWNARSIKNKTELLHQYIHENNLDLVLLTETWLSEGDSQRTVNKLEKQGFACKHIPRQNKKGGGVGVVYKKNINKRNN